MVEKMARPERHDADYFPFIVKRGKTLNILQAKYGLEGIGFFTNLMRFLTMTPDHHYFMDTQLDKMNFYAEIGISDEGKGDNILQLLSETGKIDHELWNKNRVIVSEDLLNSLKDAYLKRNNEIIKIREIRVKYTGNATLAGINDTLKDTETPQKEDKGISNTQTKVKETKVKETKVFIPPKLEEIKTYCKEKGYSINEQAVFDHYDSLDWHDTKGNKVDNWKNRIVNWASKPYNQITKPLYSSTIQKIEKFCTHKTEDGFTCGGRIKGSACMTCFTNYDYAGNEL